MSEFILFHVFGPLKTKENNKKFFLHNSISKIKESRILYIIFFFLKNMINNDIYIYIYIYNIHTHLKCKQNRHTPGVPVQSQNLRG